MPAVFCLIELGNLLGYHATHHTICHFNDRHVQTFAGCNRGNLKTNVSAPDDDEPLTLMHVFMQRSNILNVSQVMHTRQPGSGHIQFPDSRSGRNDQCLVVVRIVVHVGDCLAGNVDAGNTSS